MEEKTTYVEESYESYEFIRRQKPKILLAGPAGQIWIPV